MNPYEVLQVKSTASLKDIKAAYRRLSKEHHPDKEGGTSEGFREVQLAYDVLSDPDRRDRYNKTGRIDQDPITPAKIKTFLESMMRNVLSAEREDGSTDDPVWDNIRDKILLSLAAARVPLKNDRFRLQRKLERCVRMLERFKPLQGDDPIGDILRAERKSIEQDLVNNADAFQLSVEAERVIKTYRYDVGPGPEGHCSPGPTSRPLLSGYR